MSAWNWRNGNTVGRSRTASTSRLRQAAQRLSDPRGGRASRPSRRSGAMSKRWIVCDPRRSCSCWSQEWRGGLVVWQMRHPGDDSRLRARRSSSPRRAGRRRARRNRSRPRFRGLPMVTTSSGPVRADFDLPPALRRRLAARHGQPARVPAGRRVRAALRRSNDGRFIALDAETGHLVLEEGVRHGASPRRRQ